MPGRVAGFLAQFAQGRVAKIFAPIHVPGRDLPNVGFCGMAILPDQYQPAGIVECGDRDGIAELDHVEPVRRVVADANLINAHVENAAFECLTRRNDLNGIVHPALLAEPRRAAS